MTGGFEASDIGGKKTLPLAVQLAGRIINRQ
jgi:hypothetical protein